MSDVEILPTVVLEHARTGQPIVVDQRDYMARKDSRYADWRLMGQGDFIAPPPLPSEEACAAVPPPAPAQAPAPCAQKSRKRRRRRAHR
ncbi:hypothetical protein T8K17_08925 [Thalassobaculum sp. OXR-137]|uniref:hypothetical protein n=1 Tax=Thalassobaculum sp. OXR-137 TaxID=3100173 RepID=UPI002AC9652B|nr:hypothetical protein [Thalassobaculum sp. OXR-137]WPZ36259.1 hypothetical protein T8K17_08925 [Thalassobaculum sp. OXR-137]